MKSLQMKNKISKVRRAFQAQHSPHTIDQYAEI